MIKIGFVGDICPGGTLVNGYEFDSNIIEVLNDLDLRVCTLESAFGDGTTYCHIKSSKNIWTIIYSPDDCIRVLKELGINAVSLANNHACDCDLEGLSHTIDLLDKYGIAHFGAGKNINDARKPAIITVKGKKVCLIGYCFNDLYAPYHPTDVSGGLNLYNKQNILDDINYYKTVCDYVFVLPHWGKENSYHPKYEEWQDAKDFVNAGATAIIGSHAHRLQPVFRYKGHTIAMNMGNFIFPDRYVKPPRVTCYPEKNELTNKTIPEMWDFGFVEELTLKRLSDSARYGAVLIIRMDKIMSSRIITTYLSHNNNLQRKILPLKTRLARQVIKMSMKNVLFHRLELFALDCYNMISYRTRKLIGIIRRK